MTERTILCKIAKKEVAMKKTLVGTLVIVLLSVSTMLFASGNQDDDGGRIKLSFATSIYVEAPHKAVIDKLISTYNAKNPNVEIEVYGAGWSSFWDNMTTEILSNNEADIIQMYTSNIAQYHALRPEGTFLNLNDKIVGTPYEKDLVGQDECKYDGDYVAFSNYAWGTTGLFYRKSILEKAGVDPASIKSVEDFRNASLKLTNDNVSGFGVLVSSHSFVVSEWARFIARVISGGLYFPGEKGPFTADRINVTDPANIWAAQWWQNMILQDKSARVLKDKKDVRELFWNGKIAFNLDGPWFIGMTESRDPALLEDVGLIPQPSVEYEGKTYRPNPSQYPLITVISKNCEHQKEAWDFLKWMASKEAQEIIAECGMIPNSKSYVTESNYKATHKLAYQFYDFIANYYDPLISDPSIPQIGELQQIMIEATQRIFSSADADATAILEGAKKEMQVVMER